MTRRHLSVLLAIALVTAGCARGEARREARPDSEAPVADTSQEGGETALDRDAVATISLLRQLADRDEALIEMARLAMTRREQLQVSAEARSMLTEQRRESNRLLGLLRGEYHDTYQAKISPEDQPFLDALNGVGVGDFDRTFLETVAKHHADDMKLIDESLPTVKAPKVREVLTEIRAQRAEQAASFSKITPKKASAR